MRKLSRTVPHLVSALCLVLSGGLAAPSRAQVLDEARQAGRAAQSFPAADEDYFHDMDGGIPLTPAEVEGRDMWLVWTGGDDRLWDRLTNLTFGSFDLLKILSSYPGLKYSRDNRWEYLGLVNEPCFKKATGPDPKHYGLWLDQRSPNCPPDPFANAQKYPGVAVGARGKNIPVGSYYGEPTGIVGLRLFPNPAFDDKAAKRWDAQRYYDDPGYYLSKDLVRPYRVGMSCGFCHVSANPEKPPANPDAPPWANLSATAGAQYFWVDRILAWNADPSNFLFQVLHTARPGSLDTSLVSTDNINNPRTMNAIYDLLPRLELAKSCGARNSRTRQSRQQAVQRFRPERAADPAVSAAEYGMDPACAEGRLRFCGGARRLEPGLSEHRPLQRGMAAPFQSDPGRQDGDADRDHDGAGKFFLLAGDRGANPGHGAVFVEGVLSAQAGERAGRQCLSERPAGHNRAGQARLCRQLRDVPFEQGARPAGRRRSRRLHRRQLSRLLEPLLGVGPHRRFPQQDARRWSMAKDFLDANYLSNDARVPVTLLQTNACSPLATNAIAGNIWDNFSSASYKSLPSVGTITVYDPFTGKPLPYQMPAGGRGYTRVPSLISVWATAPFS